MRKASRFLNFPVFQLLSFLRILDSRLTEGGRHGSPLRMHGRLDDNTQVVNRAARVEGLAEGGQILMCKTTHDRVIKHVKFSSVVESLGPRKLKGIDEPEHVYQVNPHSLFLSRTLHFCHS